MPSPLDLLKSLADNRPSGSASRVIGAFGQMILTGSVPVPVWWAELTGHTAVTPSLNSGQVDGDALAYSWVERSQVPNSPGGWGNGDETGDIWTTYNAYLAEPSAGASATPLANGTLVLMWQSSNVPDVYEFAVVNSSGSSGIDFQNTVLGDVGTRVIDEADNVSGLYFTSAATPTRNVSAIYEAVPTQAGTVTPNPQQWLGEKQLISSGGGLLVTNTGGLSAVGSAAGSTGTTNYYSGSLTTGQAFAYVAGNRLGARANVSGNVFAANYKPDSYDLRYGTGPGFSGLWSFHSDSVTTTNALSNLQFSTAFSSITKSQSYVDASIAVSYFENILLGFGIGMVDTGGLPGILRVIDVPNSNSVTGVGSGSGLAFYPADLATIGDPAYGLFNYSNFVVGNTAPATLGYTLALAIGGTASSCATSGMYYGIIRYDNASASYRIFPGIDRNFAAGENPIVRGGEVIGFGSAGTSAAGTLALAPIQVNAGLTIVANQRYHVNSGSRITLTLPATAAVGDQFPIRGMGAGGWQLAQASGQTIHAAIDTTTGTGGYVQSQTPYDGVTIECVTANTDFVIIAQQGTLTTV